MLISRSEIIVHKISFMGFTLHANLRYTFMKLAITQSAEEQTINSHIINS